MTVVQSGHDAVGPELQPEPIQHDQTGTLHFGDLGRFQREGMRILSRQNQHYGKHAESECTHDESVRLRPLCILM